MGWMGYLLGPTLRAPYGANKQLCAAKPFAITLPAKFNRETTNGCFTAFAKIQLQSPIVHCIC